MCYWWFGIVRCQFVCSYPMISKIWLCIEMLVVHIQQYLFSIDNWMFLRNNRYFEAENTYLNLTQKSNISRWSVPRFIHFWYWRVLPIVSNINSSLTPERIAMLSGVTICLWLLNKIFTNDENCISAYPSLFRHVSLSMYSLWRSGKVTWVT